MHSFSQCFVITNHCKENKLAYLSLCIYVNVSGGNIKSRIAGLKKIDYFILIDVVKLYSIMFVPVHTPSLHPRTFSKVLKM